MHPVIEVGSSYDLDEEKTRAMAVAIYGWLTEGEDRKPLEPAGAASNGDAPTEPKKDDEPKEEPKIKLCHEGRDYEGAEQPAGAPRRCLRLRGSTASASSSSRRSLDRTAEGADARLVRRRGGRGHGRDGGGAERSPQGQDLLLKIANTDKTVAEKKLEHEQAEQEKQEQEQEETL